MKLLLFIFVLGIQFWQCPGSEPRIPNPGVLPFVVYFESRQRGVCVGVLVSRMLVLTAAGCVTSINGDDTRPLNVVTGSHYRHSMRGIKVQVTKILLPKMVSKLDPGVRNYQIQRSVAILVLRRKVPDVLTEEPCRAVEIDHRGEDKLHQQEECIMIGWHFFYKGDKIYPIKKFVLQRNLRYQSLVLVKKEVYCEPLVKKYEKAIDDLGHAGRFVKSDVLCLRDPQYEAQPCHGMYGSPLICSGGRVVGIFSAYGFQWENCTDFSALLHHISNSGNRAFFDCISPYFEPELRLDWRLLKRSKLDDYDAEEEVIKSIYDGVITDFSSSSSSEEVEDFYS